MSADDLIVRCAERLVKKKVKAGYYKLNGEYPPAVREEIERMKGHCKKAEGITA